MVSFSAVSTHFDDQSWRISPDFEQEESAENDASYCVQTLQEFSDAATATITVNSTIISVPFCFCWPTFCTTPRCLTTDADETMLMLCDVAF